MFLDIVQWLLPVIPLAVTWDPAWKFWRFLPCPRPCCWWDDCRYCCPNPDNEPDARCTPKRRSQIRVVVPYNGVTECAKWTEVEEEDPNQQCADPPSKCLSAGEYILDYVGGCCWFWEDPDSNCGIKSIQVCLTSNWGDVSAILTFDDGAGASNVTFVCACANSNGSAHNCASADDSTNDGGGDPVNPCTDGAPCGCVADSDCLDGQPAMDCQSEECIHVPPSYPCASRADCEFRRGPYCLEIVDFNYQGDVNTCHWCAVPGDPEAPTCRERRPQIDTGCWTGNPQRIGSPDDCRHIRVEPA